MCNDDRHKLTVWVGLVGNGTVMGLFFLPQKIDGDDYLQLINGEVVPALRQLPRCRGRRNDRFQRLWWLYYRIVLLSAVALGGRGSTHILSGMSSPPVGEKLPICRGRKDRKENSNINKPVKLWNDLPGHIKSENNLRNTKQFKIYCES